MTMMQLNIQGWSKSTMGFLKQKIALPRLMWVRKDSTLKQLHFEVFKHLR